MKAFAQFLEILAGDTQAQRLAAQLAICMGENLRIRVIDFRRLHRLAWSDDFVAGGENGHDRFTPDVDATDTDGGEHSSIAARQYVTETKHRFACCDVRPRERYIRAGRDRARYMQLIAAHLRVFDHHDGVSATRHHSSRRNRNGRAATNYGMRYNTGMDRLLAELQGVRNFFRRAERAVGDNSEAVHVRAIKRRNIDG